jgi:hypothetical protein
MKKSALLFALLVFLMSCKSYQMSTVSSLNTQKTDSTGVFRKENDSLRISYNFSGENTPIHIEVYNKRDEPLYVNWKKSALIVADKAYSYVDDKITIKGATSAVSTQYLSKGDTFTDGTISATANLSKDESFIPPHSSAGRRIYILNDLPMAKIEKKNFKKGRLTYLDGRGEVYSKSADFTVDTSPLKFRSYLTFYTLKSNQPTEFSSQQDFFVSNVTKAMSNPKHFYEYGNNPGDVIINSKVTGYAKTMGVIALVGAAGALGAAADAENDKEQR